MAARSVTKKAAVPPCTAKPCQTTSELFDYSGAALPPGLITYYATRTSRRLDDVDKALGLLASDPSLRERVDAIVGQLKAKVGHEPHGWAAEVLASFHLEGANHACTTRVILCRGEWLQSPYRVAKGIDLVGLDVNSGRMVYVEVKGSNSVEKRRRDQVMALLRADLKHRRHLEHYGSGYVESFANIAGLVALAVRQGRLPEAMTQWRPSKGALFRIGVAVCPNHAIWAPVHDGCPGDGTTESPIHLVMLHVDSVTDLLENLADVEEGLKGAGA